tara:strand:+ start:1507 stop:2517 length:1011 start_codon:yes stop_codon:yes gene_type:complete
VKSGIIPEIIFTAVSSHLANEPSRRFHERHKLLTDSIPENSGETAVPASTPDTPSHSGDMAVSEDAESAATAVSDQPQSDALEDSEDSPPTAEESDFLYKVELDIFEGPMDLLLYLIKRDEIDIYDIPIERITKHYMAYLDTFKLLNIGLAGEFLVMAANLCYIKSRMMLPKHVQPPEEDVDEEDPRWDLIRQLIEYKKFKEAAHYLGKRESEQRDHFKRKPDKIETKEEDKRPLSGDLGIFDLIRAFQNIVDRLQDDGLGEIIDDSFTVSDKIDHLLETIAPGEAIEFTTLFEGSTTKQEMIVTFLALLELMKLNIFRVRQEVLMGEIELRRNED